MESTETKRYVNDADYEEEYLSSFWETIKYLCLTPEGNKKNYKILEDTKEKKVFEFKGKEPVNVINNSEKFLFPLLDDFNKALEKKVNNEYYYIHTRGYNADKNTKFEDINQSQWTEHATYGNISYAGALSCCYFILNKYLHFGYRYSCNVPSGKCISVEFPLIEIVKDTPSEKVFKFINGEKKDSIYYVILSTKASIMPSLQKYQDMIKQKREERERKEREERERTEREEEERKEKEQKRREKKKHGFINRVKSFLGKTSSS